jgi:pilus assembly protein Flp/PilA
VQAVKKRVLGLIRDESGATAVEYGLIAAMIALAVVGGMGSITEALQAILEKIAAAFQG